MKKLVYLYIINYSRKSPDDAIMVVNMFRKDIYSVKIIKIQGDSIDKSTSIKNNGLFKSKIIEWIFNITFKWLNNKLRCIC